MRQYVVQPGDTPAEIAGRDDMAGCPKCAIDLVRANPHKATRILPNGFVTFQELYVGEKLNLPDKWFDGTLDRMPPSYFASLPHYDGVTGLAGVLGGFTELDAATTAVSLLDTMGDREFAATAGVVIDAVDFAMKEVTGGGAAASSKFATDARTATAYARSRVADMNEAINIGNQPEVAAARSDIRQSLATALGSARLALQSYYGGAGPLPPMPPPVVATAPAPAPAPAPAQPPPVQVVTAPQQPAGMSTAAMLGWGAALAAAGGALYYWKTRPRIRRVSA